MLMPNETYFITGIGGDFRVLLYNFTDFSC